MTIPDPAYDHKRAIGIKAATPGATFGPAR
jgi:hypothetical protein